MKLSYSLVVLAAGVTGALLFCGCGNLGVGPPHSKLTAGESFFVENVKPVFEKNCLRCHDGVALCGGFDLRDGHTAFLPQKGGSPYIIPGKPDGSRLIKAVARNGTHPLLMPQLPVSLTDDQIGMLREWIEDGASWPKGSEGQLHARANPENP